MAIRVYGETTAIKFVSADNIDGKADNENQQHCIDDQRCGARIKSHDQGQPRNQFNHRQDDGKQIDEYSREKIVPVYYFSKDRRRQDFAVTGINEGRAEEPAGGQFNPAVAYNVRESLIQWGALRPPNLESRR